MKILVVSSMFPSRLLPHQGVFLCREMEYLRHFGIDCHFLVPVPWAPWPLYKFNRWRFYGPENPFQNSENFRVQKACYLRPSGKWFRHCSANFSYLAVKNKARKLQETIGFDAIFGVPMIPDGQVAIKLGRDLGLPVAAMAIGSEIMVHTEEQPSLKKKVAWVLSRLDLAVGVSNELCNKLSSFGRGPTEPVCVYLGRDTQKFVPSKNKKKLRQKFGIDQDSVVGVYVGHLTPMKGMPELAEACECVFAKNPKFQMICVGQGPSRDLLSNLNVKIGRQAVILPGCVAPDEVPAYLQAADFLVFPSHSEGMPQAVLEAMNCGLAVVATPVGGIPEAVIHNETGIIVPVNNPGELQAGIERMVADFDFRMDLATAALLRSQTVFDSLRNAQKLAAAFFNMRKRKDS